jgi:uncharacterized HAD superfamily protein
MKNKIIWVDLDEVLAETVDFCLEKNNYRIWNKIIKKEDIIDYYIHQIPWIDIELNGAIDWFNKPIASDIKKLEIQPVKWAIEKILELKSNSNEIVIITARNQDKLWEYTYKWLEKYYKWLIDKVIFTDHFTDKHRHKWEVCRELWVDYMIEDNFDYALDIAKNWIKTYLLEKPWNKLQNDGHKNLKRIQLWEEFK